MASKHGQRESKKDPLKVKPKGTYLNPLDRQKGIKKQPPFKGKEVGSPGGGW